MSWSTVFSILQSLFSSTETMISTSNSGNIPFKVFIFESKFDDIGAVLEANRSGEITMKN